MEEENRRFSWPSLFIKVIIVVIFILFTVWLLSLSHKGLSNSLNVLTDNIYADNIDRMKEVGKDYFTTERLPKKVGEVKTLTLAKMYDDNLILELKDKYGHACSAKNSYVSVEKMENEYQMKVYLECGEESEFIIDIMGCYDYCDSDICERVDNNEKVTEYEYKKTTGGNWTDYGAWSEWSKVSVTKTNYRDVETRIEKEAYSYDKTIVENVYDEYTLKCPSGYEKTSDGTKCYKIVSKTVYADAVQCPSKNGDYTLVSQDGFTCNYSKKVTLTADAVQCPSKNGEYTLESQNGLTCNYSKTTTLTAKPNSCPSTSDGYTLVSQNGFTCNYSKTVTTSYQVPVTVSKTCYTTEYVIPCNKCAPVAQHVPYDCSTTSYETRYSTTTKTKTTSASCPSGYEKSGTQCVLTNKETKTTKTTCPVGYTESGNSCVKDGYDKKITSTSCPTDYKQTSDKTKCYKETTDTEYKDFTKSCPVDYKLTSDESKCYKEVSSVVKVEGTKDVTYYRYRIREYVGGTVDYKWSTSNKDENLLNSGYVLTGRTR